VKRYAVSYMESTDSFAYTRRVLDTLMGRARRLVDGLDDGEGGRKGKGVLRFLDRMAGLVQTP
jgi:geranylgeranyl diphosphate synthase type 3